MFSHVTTLSWWKTDHTETSNEDAFLSDAPHGIFVVSDGVSTQFFSRLWATILTKYFLENPLTSDNPFEVEWWLRPAQDRYKVEAPDVKTLHWSAQQKGKGGSAATLAAVRITQSDTTAAIPVLAELLAFGDSCIFIGNENTQEVRSWFPVEHVRDFEKAPVCVPSLLTKFNRKFHKCHILRNVELQANDVLILATDAVAKWILSSGAGARESVWHAFKHVADRTPSTWRDFIQGCRHARQMVDDDVTALVIRLHKEQQPHDEVLGITSGHHENVIQDRAKQFQAARDRNDKEAVAIFYGDGVDIKHAGVSVSDEEIQKAQVVADALAEVWQAFRSSINSSQFPKRVEDSWQKNAYLLKGELCAKTLIEALEVSGINMQVREDIISSEETKPIDANGTSSDIVPPNVPVSPASDDASHISASVPQANTDKDMVASVVNIMRRACDKDDDLFILETYNDLPPRYRLLLSETITKRVQLAQERSTALNQLRQVLRHGTALAMVQTYDASPALRDKQPLSLSEQKQLALARALVDAERQQDSNALLSALDAIENSEYHAHFKPTPEEQGHYNQIRRTRDITRLRQSVQMPHPTVEQLWEAWQMAEECNIFQELSTWEYNKLQLALQLKNAFNGNDKSRLVHVYISYFYSFPNQFTFSQVEQKQLEDVLKAWGKPLRPLSPVVYLGDTDVITSEQFIKTYRAARYYYLYHKQFLEQQVAKLGFEPERANEIANLESRLRQDILLSNTLNELMSDRFILKRIEEQKNIAGQLKLFEQQLKVSVDLYRKEFNVYTSNKGIHKIPKEAQVSKSDLEDVFEMWGRYFSFKEFSSGQWGMSPVEEWLYGRDGQKNRTKCIYPEWAAEVGESRNTEDSKSWIFKWKGWDANGSGDM